MRHITHRVKKIILGDPAQRAYEQLQDAYKALSRRIAAAEYHRVMAQFYTDRVLEIDPNANWWGFAHAKQCQFDHQEDQRYCQKRIEEAEATVNACRARLQQLTHNAAP